MKKQFGAADYAVFAVMLVLSAAIGVFYAFRNRKKQGTIQYLLANRSMTKVPIAISLALSFQSSLTLLALPAEVYLYGTMLLWVNLTYIILSIITAEVFIPTFYRLGIASTYEYLERRFNKLARILGTLSYIVATIFYCGIVMYGPALAFEAVTGFPLWASIISTGLVCTFYTSLGGLKGVIWTDVFQGFILLAGMLAVLIKGSMDNGGFANVWATAERGGRIDFVHFETDVRIRNTFWSVVIGATIRWAGMYGVSQSQVQRYLSCKNEKQAKLSVYLNTIGLMILITLGCLSGLVIYAQYETCDPILNKCVNRKDQIMPYMLMDTFKDYPGLAGLFLSAVYAGSLSSVSSGVNAMATVTIEDMVKPVLKSRLTDSTFTWISKLIVVIFGLLTIGMSFVLSTTKELLQAAFSLMGLMMGPLVGFFTLAIHFPFVNSPGGISGLLAGFGAGIWYYVGKRSIKKSNDLIRALPLRTDMCPSVCGVTEIVNSTFTTTLLNATESTSSYPGSGLEESIGVFNATTLPPVKYDDDVPFYTMSYHYISAIGLIATIVVGIIVSLATFGWSRRHDVDPRLLRPPFDHPLFRCCLPEGVRKYLRFGIDWEDNVNDRPDAMRLETKRNSDGCTLAQSFEPDDDKQDLKI